MSPDRPITYPATPREDVAEILFGRSIGDPWRWLEADVRHDPRVQAWVEAEAAFTEGYLASLEGRVAITDRLTALWDYERTSLPRRRGKRYFHLHNPGLEAQPMLCVRERIDGEARVLIDPNHWSEDGATALGEWEPSRDGRKLAYAVQDGGSDWRTLRFLDVATGEALPDELQWVKFSGIAWAGNGSGVFYSRFPEPRAGPGAPGGEPRPCRLFPSAGHGAGAGFPRPRHHRPAATDATSPR